MLKKNINLPIHPIKWPANNVQAFTTLRQNLNKKNVECLPFEHFNLGLHVNDDVKKVEKNRQQLLSLLPSGSDIQWLEQVHGNKVVTVNNHNISPYIADAAITTIPNIALAIMTADCLPILLSNIQGTEIAAIHGGWKPLANNIISNTVRNMLSKPSDLIAWLGPCIGPESFEVGEEVKHAFTNLNEQLSSAFIKTKMEGKYLADLQAIARFLLIEQSVNRCMTMPECTYQLREKYYSFRRDKLTGRMATVISLT